MVKLTTRFPLALLALALASHLAASAQTPVTVAGSVAGEFSVSETGAAVYRIPIQIPPGVAGMQPRLALTYNSQGGNGWLGMGWSLEGLSAISRCPRTLASDGVRGSVNFDLNDRYCLDGQRLMLVSGTYGASGSEYRTERESFSKITAHGSAGNGPAYWVVKTKAGLTMEYGNTADARIEAVKAPGATASWPVGTVRTWAQNKVSDVKGNYYTTTYTEDSVNGEYYLSRMDYSGNQATGAVTNNVIQLTYENRTDVAPAYVSGALIRGVKRLSAVQTGSTSAASMNYLIAYQSAQTGVPSYISEIKHCVLSEQRCLAPAQFTYGADGALQSTSFQGQVSNAPYTSGYGTPWQMTSGDVNGDGKADMVAFLINGSEGIRIQAFLSNGDGAYTTGPYNVPTTASYVSPPWQMTTGDVNGDGKTDMVAFLIDGSNGIRIQAFLSNGDGTYTTGPHNVPSTSSYVSPPWQMTTGDVNGDGKTDMVAFLIDGPNGIRIQAFLSNGDGTYTVGPHNVPSLTNFGAWAMTPADANGDGKTDMVAYYIGTNDGIRILPFFSNGDGTYTTGPYNAPMTVSFGWPWSMTPADVNGDGKTDMVAYYVGANDGIRILPFLANGDGTYTTGAYNSSYVYGFASPWTLTPADVNGDGKTDMVAYYIGVNDGVRILPYLSNGDGSYTTGSTIASYAYSFGSPWRFMSADVSGDGRADMVAYYIGANDGIRLMNFNAKGGFGPLKTITGLASNLTNVDYGALTSAGVYTKDSGTNAAVYPKQDLQVPMQVVSEVRKPNGLGGFNALQYKYGGLKAESGTGRGMLGFRWMSVKDVASNVETYSEFRQDFPYTGMPLKSETRLAGAGNAGVLKRSSNVLACQNPQTGASCALAAGNRYFVHVSQSTEESWDLNGVAMPSLITNYVYGQTPQFGDPTQITVDVGGQASKVTVNEYWPADTNNWILGRLKRASVTSSKP